MKMWIVGLGERRKNNSIEQRAVIDRERDQRTGGVCVTTTSLFLSLSLSFSPSPLFFFLHWMKWLFFWVGSCRHTQLLIIRERITTNNQHRVLSRDGWWLVYESTFFAIQISKSNLVDPASCHMLVSRIKPCKCKSTCILILGGLCTAH